MNLTAVHIAHMYIKECVKSGDTVIDATAGNGNDIIEFESFSDFSGIATLDPAFSKSLLAFRYWWTDGIFTASTTSMDE